MTSGEMLIEAVGYAGALLTIGTYSMRRMIPLRVVGICANVFFISYGLLADIYPQLLLHSILLPLNIFRLLELRALVRRVNAAASGNLSMEWMKKLRPDERLVHSGEQLFARGEEAEEMYYTLSGRFRVKEIDEVFTHGQIIGELGFVEPNNRRTMSVECLEDGELLVVNYSTLRQLYYTDPDFGYSLLQLISRRLFNDISRVEVRSSVAAPSHGER